MPTTDILHYASLTARIERIKSPNTFVTRRLFNRSRTIPTETFEMGTVVRGREMAPMVRRDGAAIMVGGHTKTYATVSCPNIRLKKPFSAQTTGLLGTRMPGTAIFADGGTVRQAFSDAVMYDLQGMKDMATNMVEYMCCQAAFLGAISYQVDGGDNWSVDFGRPSGNTITPGTFWDEADPTPLADLHNIKLLASEGFSGNITDGICGTEAGAAIVALAEAGSLPSLKTDSGVSAGTLSLVNQFNDDGVMFLGELGGIRLWQYSRTADLNGVDTPMIRSKYIEFVNFDNSPSGSDREIVYGLIPDLDILEGGNIMRKEFVKSWKQEDPSTRTYLYHSRPLPVIRKPDATYSFKAVAG